MEFNIVLSTFTEMAPKVSMALADTINWLSQNVVPLMGKLAAGVIVLAVFYRLFRVGLSLGGPKGGPVPEVEEESSEEETEHISASHTVDFEIKELYKALGLLALARTTLVKVREKDIVEDLDHVIEITQELLTALEGD